MIYVLEKVDRLTRTKTTTKTDEKGTIHEYVILLKMFRFCGARRLKTDLALIKYGSKALDQI